MLCTLSKFGMKDTDALDLGDLVELGNVRRVSIHAACCIVPNDDSVNLLWAKAGLQELLDPRGFTYSAMGTHKAVN